MPAEYPQIKPLLRALVMASALMVVGSGAALAQHSINTHDGSAGAGMAQGSSAQSSQPGAMDTQPMSDDERVADPASGGDYGSSNYHTPSQPVADAPAPNADPAADDSDDETGMSREAPGSDADSDSGVGLGQGPNQDQEQNQGPATDSDMIDRSDD